MIPVSSRSVQNGSNSRWAIERRPPNPLGRRGAQVHDACATFGDPLELVARAAEVLERDHRRGVHRVLVLERPVLEHPFVQRVERDRDRVRILGHRLLDDAAERRPHQRAADAELLHELVARLDVVERVEPGDRAPLQRVVVLTTGRCDPRERGVRDGPLDAVLHDEARAVAFLDVLDEPVVLLGDVLREGVGVLVHVVVHVEHRVLEVPLPHEEQLFVSHGLSSGDAPRAHS